MKEPVVVADMGATDRHAISDHESGWRYLFLLGSGLMIVGGIDVAMLFYPPQWSSLSWEFGTISGLFQGMPLITIGIGTMSAASVANGWTWTRRIMVGVTLVMTLLIVLLATVFVLDVPPALQATTDPSMKQALRMASVKTVMMALTYFVLYLALGLWTWRRLRATRLMRGTA